MPDCRDQRTLVMSEEKTMGRHRSLLEQYVELYNEGDLDGVMDLYAEDAVQVMPDGTFEGRSVIRERLARELPHSPMCTTVSPATSSRMTSSPTSGSS